MELDELKASWQRLDHQVRELKLVNHGLAIDAAIRKARWQLAPLVMGAAVGAVIGAVIALLAAIYIIDHLGSPLALFAGGTMLVMSGGFFVMHAGRLKLFRQIDFTRSVVEIQRALASLQKWEAWSFHATWVSCCIFPLAALNGAVVFLAGPYIWEHAPGYLLVNLLVLLMLGFGPLLVHGWSRRRQGKIATRMNAYIGSHSIASARAAIEEIDEFARP
jgi:hypothetical protein